jgi:hypothetical protein
MVMKNTLTRTTHQNPSFGLNVVKQPNNTGDRIDLIHHPNVNEEEIEAIYTLQGFVSQINIGPIHKYVQHYTLLTYAYLIFHSLPHAAERCQQSIHLVDLGLGFTSKYIECILAMHARLAAHVYPATLDAWNVPKDNGRDIELFFGNRYFSAPKESSNLPPIPISIDVDPQRILSTINTNKIHTEDNVVECFEQIPSMHSTQV